MGWIINFDHDSPCYVPMEYDMTKETFAKI